MEGYVSEVCKLHLKTISSSKFPKTLLEYTPIQPYSSMLFIFDIDHTLTTENLYEMLFENMKNRRVREKVPLLKKLFLKLVCEHENKGWEELLSQELRETRMKKEDYLEAKEKTIKEAKLTPGALQAKEDLERMGFTIALNSGEPTDLVQEFAVEKLSVPATFCYGSTFEWDEKGYFRGMRHNLGYNKLEATQMIARVFGCSPDLCIYSTDIDSAKEIGLEEPLFARGGLGLYIGIPRKCEEEISHELPKYPDVVYFGDPSLKEDLRKITDIVKSWLVGKLTTLFLDPSSYYRICLTLNDIKRLRDILYSLDEESIKSAAQKFVRDVRLVEEKLKFRCFDLGPKVREMLDMLEKGEIEKNIINYICSEIETKIPEWYFTEEDMEKIKKYAKVK